VHRIGRTGRAGASGLAITLVTRDDTRLVADIEKLIRKKTELEPLELEPERPPRRQRRDWSDDSAEPRAPSRTYSPPRVASPASDPFFDRPYEASSAEAAPAWETRAPAAAPRSVSPNIKPRRKVAALLGGSAAPAKTPA
jgi:superfamily II DNA/RNA helicase